MSGTQTGNIFRWAGAWRLAFGMGQRRTPLRHLFLLWTWPVGYGTGRPFI